MKVLLLAIFITFIFSGDILSQNKRDSLLSKLENQQKLSTYREDSTTVVVLNELAKAFMYDITDTAYYYSNKALELAQNQGYKLGEGYALNNLATAYYVKGEYLQALEYYLKSFRVFKSLYNRRRMAIALNNIGLIYMAQKEFESAIDQYKNILVDYKDVMDERLTTMCFFNLGVCQDEVGSYDAALKYLNKAIDISEKVNFKRLNVLSRNRLGETYYHLRDYEKAIRQYRLVINDTSYQNNWENSFAHGGISQVYYQLKDPDSAIIYGKISLGYSNKLSANWEKARVLEILAKSFASLKNFDSAYQYEVLYKKYSDSLFNENKEKEINYLHLKQKETQNLQLTQENQINKERLNVNHLIVVIIAVIAGFTLLLTYFIYRRNVIKGRLNKELEEQREKILQQNEDLAILNQTKDKIFSIISHDLRSPLSSIRGTLEVIRLDSISASEKRKIFTGLHNKVITVSQMLDNLLHWANSQQTQMNAQPTAINLPEITEKVLTVANFLAVEKGILIEHESEEELMIYADMNHVTIILQNLITNAIKFTPKGGLITLFYTSDSLFHALHVKDNGIGMSADKLDKLFKISEKHISVEGTQSEKGTGTCLSVCSK